LVDFAYDEYLAEGRCKTPARCPRLGTWPAGRNGAHL